MQITQYVKDHPWATGIIVVVGGFIFLMIFRGGSSSGSGSGYTGPSADAQLAADTQIQSAQIAASAQAAQYNAAAQVAQIGAGVQMNSDNKAAEVAMAAIQAQKDAVTSTNDTIYHTILERNPGGFETRDILVALATGQPQMSTSNTMAHITTKQVNQSSGGIAGVINSLGNLAKGGASLATAFSDQRLKENIHFVGYDKNGLSIYEWNYRGSKRKYRGYIAQDVARSHPEAVTVDPGTGYWKVNTLRLASI